MRLRRALDEFIVDGIDTTLPLVPNARAQFRHPGWRLRHSLAGAFSGGWRHGQPDRLTDESSVALRPAGGPRPHGGWRRLVFLARRRAAAPARWPDRRWVARPPLSRPQSLRTKRARESRACARPRNSAKGCEKHFRSALPPPRSQRSLRRKISFSLRPVPTTRVSLSPRWLSPDWTHADAFVYWRVDEKDRLIFLDGHVSRTNSMRPSPKHKAGAGKQLRGRQT